MDTYDKDILTLLHRMPNLENLTLHLRVEDRQTLIDRNHLENEICLYMPRLQSFIFYIRTRTTYTDVLSNVIDEVSIHFRQQPIVNITNRIMGGDEIAYHIFTLPFLFDEIGSIGFIFPNIKFEYVTNLVIEDIIPFNHDYFVRLSFAFPLLSRLCIINSLQETSTGTIEDTQSSRIAQYSHLTSLNLRSAARDSVEEFLNETKSFLPCLTELIMFYSKLTTVTNYFTREETRRNCANVKRLNILGTYAHTEHFYLYFPSLEMSYFEIREH